VKTPDLGLEYSETDDHIRFEAAVKKLIVPISRRSTEYLVKLCHASSRAPLHTPSGWSGDPALILRHRPRGNVERRAHGGRSSSIETLIQMKSMKVKNKMKNISNKEFQHFVKQ
jgi:hypothetical protein